MQCIAFHLRECFIPSYSILFQFIQPHSFLLRFMKSILRMVQARIRVSATRCFFLPRTRSSGRSAHRLYIRLQGSEQCAPCRRARTATYPDQPGTYPDHPKTYLCVFEAIPASPPVVQAVLEMRYKNSFDQKCILNCSQMHFFQATWRQNLNLQPSVRK